MRILTLVNGGLCDKAEGVLTVALGKASCLEQLALSICTALSRPTEASQVEL